MTKKIVLVDTISVFHIVYAVEVEDDPLHALDEVVMRQDDLEFAEFSQKHIGCNIVTHRVVDEDEYLAMFEAQNEGSYIWTRAQKLNVINKIDYEKLDEAKK